MSINPIGFLGYVPCLPALDSSKASHRPDRSRGTSSELRRTCPSCGKPERTPAQTTYIASHVGSPSLPHLPAMHSATKTRQGLQKIPVLLISVCPKKKNLHP